MGQPCLSRRTEGKGRHGTHIVYRKPEPRRFCAHVHLVACGVWAYRYSVYSDSVQAVIPQRVCRSVVTTHILYSMPSVRSGLPYAAYTVLNSTSVYPYGAGHFHPQRSAYRTSVPIPGTGDCRIYKELMQWKEYLPVCTDTITLFSLYRQQLF